MGIINRNTGNINNMLNKIEKCQIGKKPLNM